MSIQIFVYLRVVKRRDLGAFVPVPWQRPNASEQAVRLHGSSWVWRAACNQEPSSEEAVVVASCAAAKTGILFQHARTYVGSLRRADERRDSCQIKTRRARHHARHARRHVTSADDGANHSAAQLHGELSRYASAHGQE